MDERIHIEPPDAARAAYLMERLVGRFEARLIEAGDGRWEVVVDPGPGPEPFNVLTAVLEVVQRWVDPERGNYVTITFRDHVYAMGYQASARRRQLTSVG